jgi:hypothetical protein
VAFVINSLVVAVAVMIHYEFLSRLSLLALPLRIKNRARILVGVFVALAAHAVEIWIFALAYFLMNYGEGWGELTGNFSGSLLDSAYFFSPFIQHWGLVMRCRWTTSDI